MSAHELGHAVDRDFDLPSGGTPWGSYLTRDTFDLNMVQALNGGFTHRYPCKPTLLGMDGMGNPVYSVNVPFAGVVYLPNGQNVCNADGTINNGILPSGQTWNQDTETGFDLLTYIENLWLTNAEVHAQVFAWEAVGNQGAKPMTDKVLDNSFMPCLKSWANSEQNTGALPGGVCSAPLTH